MQFWCKTICFWRGMRHRTAWEDSCYLWKFSVLLQKNNLYKLGKGLNILTLKADCQTKVNAPGFPARTLHKLCHGLSKGEIQIYEPVMSTNRFHISFCFLGVHPSKSAKKLRTNAKMAFDKCFRKGFTDAQMSDLRRAFQKNKMEDTERTCPEIFRRRFCWGYVFNLELSRTPSFEYFQKVLNFPEASDFSFPIENPWWSASVALERNPSDLVGGKPRDVLCKVWVGFNQGVFNDISFFHSQLSGMF